MPNVLISGPAGAGKSQRARELKQERGGLVVIADFQSLYVAISGDKRGPDGLYPLRDERLLPTVEYLRRATISAAVAREIAVIGTNSDGSPARRAFLLGELGEDAEEIIIDPGEEVVQARLKSRKTGRLSRSCKLATDRWFRRLGGRRR